MKGKEKDPEQDDPFELKGVAIEGDEERMIECMIEEYARMGWNEERLMRMFTTPNFRIPHQYYEKHGEEAVREKIREVLKQHGVYEFEVDKPQEESDGQ